MPKRLRYHCANASGFAPEKTNLRFQSLFPCSLQSLHVPIKRAYRLRATPISVVPLMIARPSGNTIRL